MSFIRPRHRRGWLSLWDVSQGRAGSHHGMLVKAEKATTALLSALPVPQPPRAAGLLLPKEGSGFAVLLPQQDQLLPVSQEGASPADQALPSCSPPHHPQGPSLLPHSSRSGDCSGHRHRHDHNSGDGSFARRNQPFQFHIPVTSHSSHASPEEPSAFSGRAI